MAKWMVEDRPLGYFTIQVEKYDLIKFLEEYKREAYERGYKDGLARERDAYGYRERRITMPVVHELKILPQYYEEVKECRKNFELRKDDRGYKVHDILILRAWDGEYLDRTPLEREIKFILRDCPEYGLMQGYVILGFGT